MAVHIKIKIGLILFLVLHSQSAHLPTNLNEEPEISLLKVTSTDYTLSEIQSAEISDNTIDEDEEALLEYFSGKSRRKQSQIEPPLLIKLIHDQITRASKDETYKLFASATHSGPLLRAWLPLEISREETTGTTEVHFQQTIDRKRVGNFTDARIILTLREDVQLTDIGWTLTSLLPGKNASSKSLHSTIRFYDFNITNYLQRTLVQKLEHPAPIVLTFQLEHEGNVLFLDDLFDVQVQQPFILLQYQHLPEGLFSNLREHHLIHRHRRISRSISESSTPSGSSDSVSLDVISSATISTTTVNTLNPPPLIVGNETIIPSPSVEPPSKHCCRRHELIVRPQELHWNNVFQPSSFDLGYCSGTCPFPIQNEYYNFTLHTTLLDRYRQSKGFDAPSNLPHSTCVPTKYKDVSVLIEDEEELAYELRLYKKILVAECGCR